MHDDRDPPDGDRTPAGPPRAHAPTTPSLVIDDDGIVGFLDAPAAEPAELVAAVIAAFDRLIEDGVLTVHSRLPDPGTVLTRLSDDHHITVIGSITHAEGGTTLTVRRDGVATPSIYTEPRRPR